MTEKCTPVRLLVWCYPRAISTAFAKCLSAIDEMEVWFEPYGMCHLARGEYKRFCNEELPMEYDGNGEKYQKAAELLSDLTSAKMEPNRISYSLIKKRLDNISSKYVLVKDMVFSMATAPCRQYLPTGYKHVFLIRDPVRSINSYRTATYTSLLEIGYLQGEAKDERKFDLDVHNPVLMAGSFHKNLNDLWKYIQARFDSSPIIIDADDLLTKPAETLAKFCEATGLPYSESLLKWDESTDALKSWKAAGDNLLLSGNPNFYGTAVRSSSFMPPSKPVPHDQLSEDVIRLSQAAVPYYKEMYDNRV